VHIQENIMAYSDAVIEAARKQLTTVVEEVAAYLQCGLGVTRITTDTNSVPDLAAMRRQYFTMHSITVWTGASDRTIYIRRDVNTAFRFWHDYVHIVHNLGFTYEDERKVNYIQRKTIEYHVNKRRGILHDDVIDAVLELFDADTNGQLEYHAMTGEFPHDQLHFAKCVLNGTFSTHKPLVGRLP